MIYSKHSIYLKGSLTFVTTSKDDHIAYNMTSFWQAYFKFLNSNPGEHPREQFGARPGGS